MKLSECVRLFAEAGVDSPRYDAEEIFINIGGFGITECKLEDPSSDNPRLLDAVSRRRNREPLQYILGFADFYRERYEVNPNCLIPRSDTEILVDLAVRMIPEGENFLDLCTGSGCVGISTLKNTKGTRATLVDISEGALELAKRNALANGVSDRAEFSLADVFTYTPKREYFAILSNPPYLSGEEYEGLEREIYFEPKIAFLGGADGMDFYRSIVSKMGDYLKEGGFFAFEIGYSEEEKIRAVGAEWGFSVEVFKDLSSNTRVALLKRCATDK